MTGGRISRLALGCVSMAVAALMAAQPLSAASLTSVVTDPVGDTSFFAPGIVGQPYQDIVKASITLKDGRFIFVMDVAAPIPASPVLPPGVVLEDWGWRLDTNTATFPAGFPFSPGLPAPWEFFVDVFWDGTSFTGTVIDRRPLLTGMDAVVIPVPFSIKGNEITFAVDAALLGNPTSFNWRALTSIWPSPLGTFSQLPLDSAPDTGLATWPS